MALIHVEGFDKFGPPNNLNATVAALLGTEYTVGGSGSALVNPLSSAGGYAVSVTNGGTITKALGANYGRLIGGFRFSFNLSSGSVGIQFNDASTNQAGLQFNSTGTIAIKNGIYNNATALATSTATILANSIHYLEFDITFANAGSYQIWLDGVSIISGSGDTQGSATNAFINSFGIVSAAGGAGVLIVDDLYLFDTTGSVNNAVLLNSPRVETQFPVSDNAVQFAVGAAILGFSNNRGGVSAYTATANNLYLRPFVPAVNCTLNSIGLSPSATNASIQLRPVAYADSGGVPGALMSDGATVTGITSGTLVTLPLTTPQSLVAGTRYWLGLMNDISVSNAYAAQDTSANARWVVATFASGAPSTAPAMTGGQVAAIIFGNVSTSVNYYSVAPNPQQGNLSYVYEATVGEEDLYNYPPTTAPVVHGVAVKASLAKSDSGTKTASVRLKSGSTNSGGSLASVTPGTTYGWAATYFQVDPNTSAAWTPVGLNAAQAGVRVAS